jgi:uncharacterized repeat protein (TIGR01451 family)
MLRTCVVLLLAGLCNAANAVYVQRFSTIDNGAVTFTGNTIGLSKQNNANAPGTAGSIGTFISAGATTTDGTYPTGTTANWTANGSSAVLNLPAGSTVLYAELIWSGSYSYGGESVFASLGTAVTLVTPLATSSVTPATATAQTLGTAGGGGTCTSGPCFYVRSQNVTALVQAAGAGTYTVRGIPSTQGNSENNSNTGGWTLAVAYRNTALPARNLTIFTSAEVGGAAAATVSGFCTPPTGPREGRLLVSALEGDSDITGDQMQFGPTATSLSPISGPNNLVSNFFASQINGNTGALDTSGSFGTSNHTPGTNASGRRQGYDITNVDVSSLLLNNQTTASARGTTSGDQYLINALALQINVGAPIFPITVKSVDKTVTTVGDTLTYTVRLDNTAGTANATNVTFLDNIPPGTSFVPGSLTVDGTPNAGSPVTGVNIGSVNAGSVRIVRFQVAVNSIPSAPAQAAYSNSASWNYQFISCAGQPTSNGSVATNAVVTNIARLAIGKAVAPTGTATPGATTLTYTITMTNDGTAASSGTTLADAIPAGTTYVAGSTTLNGAAVADISGAMPFSTARPVNSPGQAAGVIAVGATATVSFRVTVNSDTTATIVNTATGDIDGAGAAPSQTATVSTPVQPIVNLSVIKTNNAGTQVTANQTTYRITVSNAGPSSANGSVLRDPAVSGLTCTAINCVAVTGASACPSPATVTITNLQGAGIVLPTLPANSSLAFDLVCNVVATGQ